MRLDKYLTECGVGSRSEVKKILTKKEIRVNGKIINNASFKLNMEKDIVEYKNKKLEYKKYRYYVLNKKAGYITAVKDNREKTVMELLPDNIVLKDLFPVGRLDKDTEGLLLFTNNGTLAHRLSSPKRHVDKKYYVKLERNISDEDIKKLESGVEIDIKGEKYLTKRSKVENLSPTEINLTISEGKFHQVKKMLEAVENSVIYLKRLSFGRLELGNMKLGELREVLEEDIL